jgi:predicted small secreted protein
MKSLTKIALLAALVAGTSFLSACHTVKGAGQDVEQAGKEIQKASDKSH